MRVRFIARVEKMEAAARELREERDRLAASSRRADARIIELEAARAAAAARIDEQAAKIDEQCITIDILEVREAAMEAATATETDGPPIPTEEDSTSTGGAARSATPPRETAEEPVAAEEARPSDTETSARQASFISTPPGMGGELGAEISEQHRYTPSDPAGPAHWGSSAPSASGAENGAVP